MKKIFIELTDYKKPEAIIKKDEVLIKRGFQSFSLNHLGSHGSELIKSIINKCNYPDIISWINEQPIIVRSKMIGTLNTLFANRVLKVTATNQQNHLLSIEGLDRSSKLIGKTSLIKMNTNNIYMYHQENKWYLESFSNKTILSSENSNQPIIDFISKIQGSIDFSTNQNVTSSQFIEDIISIFMLNERERGEYDNSSTKKYWNFHDKVFDRRTRSWNDNVTRSGSYRFIPDQPPHYNMIKGNKPLEYHKLSDIVNPLSKRIGEESDEITEIELNELCARAFMDIEVNNETEISSKYKKERYRPYPSAGGIYELEIYILLKNPGDESHSLIKYNPNSNDFTSIDKENINTDGILEYVKRCWITETAPRYVLLMVGNYAQLSYKYENIAYRLMLINAGCAVSSFYRACRSLSIGCCCTGCGPSDLIRGIIPNGESFTPLMEIGFGKINA